MLKSNNKVVCHTYGKKVANEFNTMSNSCATNGYLQQRAVMENCTVIDKSVSEKERVIEARKVQSTIQMKAVNENMMLSGLNKIGTTGKDVVLKDIIFEMYQKSLLIDEDFVLENLSALKEVSDSFVDEIGGYAALESASKKSKLLKNVKKTVDKTVEKVVKRKLKSAKENQEEYIDFDMNTDEKNELDYEKDNIGVDQISEIVKDKVLTVVKDEKEREKKQSELEQEIQDLASEEDTEAEKVTESLRRFHAGGVILEQSTLFNSLLRNSYQVSLENMAVTHTDYDADEEHDVEMYREHIPTTDELASEYNEFDINMDMILTESIAKYTLYELVNTIQLESYDTLSVKKICNGLVKMV